jgi:hypothetical protein
VSFNHREAGQAFEETFNFDKEQRELSLEESRFVNAEGGQWDDDAETKRANRPRYTVDRISPGLDQVIGDQRQNRMSIKVEPETDGDEGIAKILTGRIRSIEQINSAQNAYDNAFREVLEGGYGGWRILTEFENETSFNQRIIIKPILSAVSALYFSADAEQYTKADATEAWVISWIPVESFKKQYPDASPNNFGPDLTSNARFNSWYAGEKIRVAEYWYKKAKKIKIGLMSDGRVIDLEEEKQVLDELVEQGITVLRERETETFDVEMVHMSGADFLTEPEAWAGKFIPLVPLYGKQAIIDGKNFTRGMVRKAKDAQQIYNYAISSAIEATALTPKDPIWFTPEQFAGHKRAWELFPTQNSPFLPYNADPKAPGPPQRGGAPQLQQALIQQVDQAAGNIYHTTGIEPASLGNSPELKSGKAIIAQQRMGDRGTYVYTNNLEKSLKYTGEILLDLIPKIDDTPREVKILSMDGQSEQIEINTPQTDERGQAVIDQETGEQVIVNDLTKGEYSVVISTGPSFSTQRQETVAQLTELANNNEMISQLALDLIIDNMNLNNGDEIKSRVRKQMIQQGLIEPTDEEVKELGLDQPQQPDPMQEALRTNVEVQTEKLIAEIKNKDADTQKKFYEAQKTVVDALTSLKDILLKKQEQGAPLTLDEAELVQGQEAMAAESQIDVLEQNELADSQKLRQQ